MFDKKESEEISISIHAPTRGATTGVGSFTIVKTFQSTLPREERRLTDDEDNHFTRISIHAPTRGATAILHKKFVYFYTIPTINI